MSEYLKFRLRFCTWFAVSTTLALICFVMNQDASLQKSLQRVVLFFFTLLSLRIFDDLACAAYERSQNTRRGYHGQDVAQPLQVLCGVLFSAALAFGYLYEQWTWQLPLLYVISGLLYFLFYKVRQQYVQYVSLIKYPYILSFFTPPPLIWIQGVVLLILIARESKGVPHEG